MTSVMMIAFLLVSVSGFMVFVSVIMMSRMLMNVIVCMGISGRRFLSLSIKNDDLCGGDAAAVYFFDLERCSDVEGRNCIVKNLWWKTCVEKSAEEHISADTGKAVEVGDAHEAIVSR